MAHGDTERQGQPHDGRPAEDALLELGGHPDRWALFLDIDGTLIDLAETPDAIVVPAGLADDLAALSQQLGGALALVTGRSLAYADGLFSPHAFPLAGLHGAERRDGAGRITRLEPPPHFPALKAELAREAQGIPGILIEDKGAAVAAHYRQAPEREAQVEALMARYLQKAGSEFALQRGKMVVEIRPAAASKGAALQAFLTAPPFAGRLPLAIGDDITDEAMFDAANRLGGQSIRIAANASETGARLALPSPAALRRIIGRIAHRADRNNGKDRI